MDPDLVPSPSENFIAITKSASLEAENFIRQLQDFLKDPIMTNNIPPALEARREKLNAALKDPRELHPKMKAAMAVDTSGPQEGEV